MKKLIALGVFAVVSITLPSYIILSKNGKAGYAGSPGESSCNHCHNTFPINSAGGSIKITTDIPGDMYAPSTTYQISVTVARPGVSLFGFGCEALTPDLTNGGTFVVTNTTRTQKINAPNGRANMTHKLNGGAFADSSVFTFNWTSPSTDEGNITFYFTGVCANGNNSNSLDYVYKGSKTITPSPVFAIEEEVPYSDLKIIPHYNEQEVEVHLTLKEKATIAVHLTGLDGKQIAQAKFVDQDAGAQEYRIQTSSITQGVYVLQAQINQTSVSKKFLLVQ